MGLNEMTHQRPYGLIFLYLITTVLGGCATSEKAADRVEVPTSVPVAESQAPSLDLDLVERTLHMDRSKAALGFEEQKFDPCELNLQKVACGPRFLVTLNFQLQCRDIDGTVENYRVEPIHADQINWSLGRTLKGVSSTDHEGYGQIRVLASASSARLKLRLTLNNDFLIVNVNEVKRIVTPPQWCAK